MSFPQPVRVACLVIFALVAGTQPGCRDDEPEAKPKKVAEPGKQLVVSPAVPAKSQQAKKGADAGDAPNSPSCLPATGAVTGWDKTESIRVYLAGELAGAVSPASALSLAHFRVLSAATCAYSTTLESGVLQTARVLYLETESSDDAYGILTCQSDSTETLKVGGETRVERFDGYHLHCWQGKSYVRVSTVATDTETTEQVIRLLFNIAGRIPREDRPLLPEAMPGDAELLEHLWLVRHLKSLPPKALGFAHAPDAEKSSRLLGLDESTLVCVAHYRVPDGRGPNVIWLVQYPSNKAAYDAHARYTEHLERSRDAASLSTNLMPPHAAYLMGTWTAEEEALQYMLPRVAKLLPL